MVLRAALTNPAAWSALNIESAAIKSAP